jgi:hypothetical protein
LCRYVIEVLSISKTAILIFYFNFVSPRAPWKIFFEVKLVKVAVVALE